MISQKQIGKIVIPVVLIVAFFVFASQQKGKSSGSPPVAPVVQEAKPVASLSPVKTPVKSEKKASSRSSATEAKEKQASAPAQKPLRLVDLGAGKCIPCKMMAPILEELRNEYQGKLQVEIIDVWENRSAAEQYKIRVIPTQIFFDPSGKELFRHEGFMGKEDILAKWKELGFNLIAAS